MESPFSASVIGAGALGKALTYSLTRAQMGPVSLHARIDQVKEAFSVLEGSLHHIVEPSPNVFDGSSLSALFFTTKAYDLPSALRTWLPRLNSTTPKPRIIILCNGYIEPLLRDVRREFPDFELFKGIATRGAKFLADGTLALSAAGDFAWGNESSPLGWEQKLFERRREIHWNAESCSFRRDKWYCNSVLNTLSGAYRLTSNGHALHHPDFDALSREVYELGTKIWPEWKADGQRERLDELLRKLILVTKDNENSMAVDVRLSRRTEIDVLSGTVFHVDTETNEFPMLKTLHRQIESRS